jgi:NADPH:quinone reductase-like Zn-dependent oxidoreductase
MRAVVVERAAAGGVRLAEVAEPAPLPHEALIAVKAISLNLGEVRRSQSAADGWRPGWDFAGIVERQAADGTGPAAGARIVGVLDAGAWAERVAAPAERLAELPEGLTFERASTLPIAGLTALYALEKPGALLGRSVLVTGASGGVGVFAMQLARLAGARVTALVHRPERRAAAEAYADEVLVGEIEGSARYDLVLESIGGTVFASALAALAPGGMLVTFGTSADRTSSIDVAGFYPRGGCTIYGFYIFHELAAQPASAGLGRLAGLLDRGPLDVHIDDVLPIERIGDAVERLWSRGVIGKLVVRW